MKASCSVAVDYIRVIGTKFAINDIVRSDRGRYESSRSIPLKEKQTLD